MSIAIPLAGLTVVTTLIGGRVGLRFSNHLETLLALTGGVVVAIALLDVLPEGIDGVGDVDLATPSATCSACTAGFSIHRRQRPPARGALTRILGPSRAHRSRLRA